MTKTDMSSKSKDELLSVLVEQKKEYFNLRFQKTMGQLTNTSSIRIARRNIARTMTALSSINKELADVA